MDRKYVVIKKSDLDEYLDTWEGTLGGSPALRSDLESIDLQDAEVIRGQDLTAASIFYHYASTLQSYAEILEQAEGVSNRVKHLREVADYFFEAAHRSEQRQDRKLPD